jgi:hypothetical protein
MQSDTNDFYEDIEGQAAARKREQKQRRLLALGKYIQRMYLFMC